jgi:DNA-directed RNA polymerase sigma subunit (sigma70/sigma32)
MTRITLEEFIWENFSSELLDKLNSQNREIIQYYFGLEPYRPHTVSAVARWLGKPYTSTRTQIRIILQNLKKEIVKSYK